MLPLQVRISSCTFAQKIDRRSRSAPLCAQKIVHTHPEFSRSQTTNLHQFATMHLRRSRSIGVLRQRPNWVSREPVERLRVRKRGTLRRVDPSGLDDVSTLGDCKAEVDAFVAENKSPCKGQKIKVRCLRSPEGSNGVGGRTGCEDGGNTIVMYIYYDRTRTRGGIRRLIEHEFQHAKDICSCDKKCKITTPDPTKDFDWGFCNAKACMEVRACQASDCKGRSGTDLKECVARCALESIKESEYCNGKSLLTKALKDCFKPDGDLGPFPY